ncbi:hypothetical protein ACFE04_028824 [Oxalis oulophora]
MIVPDRISAAALWDRAVLTDNATVSPSMYHDSLIWRIIALGANERCLPVILLTSNSDYSYQAYMDFGFPDIFASRETFGWSVQEAKMHMVPDYFSNSEKFAIDAQSGKILKDKLRFGAPWRHPPQTDDPDTCLEWAKLQLADFVQSYFNTEFGIITLRQVNYLGDCSLEIFDDPSANALLEVGLLYAQRDPSLIRPVSRGIQRCLVRWLVQEQMQMSPNNLLEFKWQRAFRGRSYRHLMLQLGYK